LPYDDEQTPLKLIGKKMLPILTHDNVATNESLDIIMLVDKLNILKVSELIQTSAFKDLEKFLNRISGPVHSLAMPYWIFTPEFSESSRKYFQMKKEEKRGPFSELIKKQKDYISELTPLLNDLENNLRPFYKSNVFSLNDILIAAHLWGLYVVPEFQFSEKIHHYLQTIKHECRFNYHKDLWN
jgi:glutaredoxin 2